MVPSLTQKNLDVVSPGSVLGPDLFAIYSLQLADLIRKHDVPFQFFADDGQRYVMFDPVGPKRVKLTKDKMEELIPDVSQWLLKLNTMVMLIIKIHTKILKK